METAQVVLAIALVVWVVAGIAVAFIMRRSGHDFALWLLLGVLLGPFTALFALERHRRDERRSVGRVGNIHSDRFDAIAAIDGSDESIDAARIAVDLFGDSLDSLTLVTVLDYEAGASFIPKSHAYSLLGEVASRIEFEPVETAVIYGPLAAALSKLAQESGFELIIVGARGWGMSEAIFGSVTASLIGESGIPVFVGPRLSVASASPGRGSA
jgi:nucleotide-binding universal stress UspA family protein